MNRFTPRPKLAPVHDQVLPRIISLLAIVDWSGMGWPVTGHKGPKSTVGENNRFGEILLFTAAAQACKLLFGPY